ncbi:hypothetical protein [Carnobacterium inhibens]|uniref:hypothetical protein n=1 Tax=Carnobacterium inhibens TaxID=147709 RepID=UPI000550170C|nr:hypothetical protein [Carnobacterium inhibens]
MIKGTKGLMLLSVSFFLSGCGFNEEEALVQSTDQLESFLTLHEERERFSDLSNDDLQARLEEDVFPYLTESYQETITEEVENYEVNTDAAFSRNTFFLRESGEEYDNGVLWRAFDIDESEVNTEDETVTYLISTDYTSVSSSDVLNVEMTKENGDWKVNATSDWEW